MFSGENEMKRPTFRVQLLLVPAFVFLVLDRGENGGTEWEEAASIDDLVSSRDDQRRDLGVVTNASAAVMVLGSMISSVVLAASDACVVVQATRMRSSHPARFAGDEVTVTA